MIFIYNLAIFFYVFVIRIASLLGNPKASLWITGRKNWKEKIKTFKKRDDKTFWFHCSSLGEFEQGRPLIEEFRKHFPSSNIILSFYSPSGYEIRKNYEYADLVCYLPSDTKKNATYFIDTLKPDQAFFIKYDYWYHFLSVLHEKNIPSFIVSGIFRKQQSFFKWYGTFSRKMLGCVKHFFVQDINSGTLLQSLGLFNFTISGDTRFDRVVKNVSAANRSEIIESFKGNSYLLVCGSTWPADEQIICEALMHLDKENLKLIIAPHEISDQRVQQIINTISKYLPEIKVVVYSNKDSDTIEDAKILILDTMGQLASVYGYGSFAYVGGGFNKGIHNTLEPAAFALPLIFGPEHSKFREANELIREGAAFVVRTDTELALILDTFSKQKNFIKGAGKAASEYVQKNTGATQKIMDFLINQKNN